VNAPRLPDTNQTGWYSRLSWPRWLGT